MILKVDSNFLDIIDTAELDERYELCFIYNIDTWIVDKLEKSLLENLPQLEKLQIKKISSSLLPPDEVLLFINKPVILDIPKLEINKNLSFTEMWELYKDVAMWNSGIINHRESVKND